MKRLFISFTSWNCRSAINLNSLPTKFRLRLCVSYPVYLYSLAGSVLVESKPLSFQAEMHQMLESMSNR